MHRTTVIYFFNQSKLKREVLLFGVSSRSELLGGKRASCINQDEHRCIEGIGYSLRKKKNTKTQKGDYRGWASQLKVSPIFIF